MLLAEIERRPSLLSTNDLESIDIHFSDTLPLLQQVFVACVLIVIKICMHMHTMQLKKSGHQMLSGTTLGIGKLFEHFFPSERFSGNLGHYSNTSLLNCYTLIQLTRLFQMLRP